MPPIFGIRLLRLLSPGTIGMKLERFDSRMFTKTGVSGVEQSCKYQWGGPGTSASKTSASGLGCLTRAPATAASEASTIYGVALALGLVLRLVAVFYGDIGPGGDGTERLALAISWAQHPAWTGLSGVWPHAHWYFLGALIRVWNNPVLLAKLVNLVFGFGSIVAIRRAVRPLYGDMAGSISALLLAIFWTHIWLTSSYWVEPSYLFFVLLAVSQAQRAAAFPHWKSALSCGALLALAILLRHEGMLLLVMFSLWFALRTRKPSVVAAFAAIPVCLAAWYFIEPLLQGHSYLEYANFVKAAKAGENLIQGFTLKDCLVQWVLMPAAIPSVLIVLPGLYALWRVRRSAALDLFAWMFIGQVLFYSFMTLTSAWRPQLRYIMLYFVNLLPYAAIAWERLAARLQPRYLVYALAGAAMLLQGTAWYIGRNERRSLGWLPIEIRTSSQKTLDDWLLSKDTEAKGPINILGVSPGPSSDSWSLHHSEVVDSTTGGRIRSKTLYVPEVPEVLQGRLPAEAIEADLILIYPGAVFYPAVLDGLNSRGIDVTVGLIHPDIAVLTLSRRNASFQLTGSTGGNW